MAKLLTFQSTTLEGLFLEIALLLQEGELNNTKNVQNLNLVNVTINSDAQQAMIEATLPIDTVPTQNGTFAVARPYLLD